MHCSTRDVSALFLASLLLCFCQPTAAREWTNAAGRVVKADFVRVVGGNVVLQLPTGRVIQIPLAELSTSDQDFIRKQLSAVGIRVWTDLQGRQVPAALVRVRDENVYLKTNTKTVPVPFATLSSADRLFVRRALVERGKPTDLPPPTDDETLSEVRKWMDVDGVEADGQFERVLPDGRVFLVVEEEIRIVLIGKLSQEDHDYLREKLDGTALAKLVPPKPAPPPKALAVETRPPPVAVPTPVLPPQIVLPPRPEPVPRPIARQPQPTPTYQPPHVVPTMRLQCSRCGRDAPPGASYNDPCPYCNKRGDGAYEMGKKFGIVARYIVFIPLIALFLGWLWRRFS